MKAVSISHELSTIERAVEGAAALVELGRQGGIEGEDTGAFAAAVLALAATRLRDLGRVTRAAVDVEQFWAPHNAAVKTPGGRTSEIILRSGRSPSCIRRRR